MTEQTTDLKKEAAKKILSFAVFEAAVHVVVAAVISQVWILRLPIIKQLFGYAVGKLGKMIYKQLDETITFIIISNEVGEQKEKFQAAVEELKVVTETGDKNEIDKAKEKFKSTLGDLIRFKPR